MSATIEELMEWRGIEKPCARCDGTGWHVYGSTSTWRGGIGGHAMTPDVCDACWGSGDAGHPWTDLRALEAKHREARARKALDEMVERFRFKGEYMRADVRALADLLDAIGEGRIGRGKVLRGAREFARALASMIRPMATEG